MSAKEAVLEIVSKMPDEASMSDILDELHMRQEIEESRRELDAGLGIPHEEAMKRLTRWLK